MADNGGGSGWLLKGLGCMGVLAILCCCGGFVGIQLFPMMFLSYFLSDTPLPGPTVEPKPVVAALEQGAACALLATVGEARLSPEAVERWVAGKGDPELRVLRVGASGDEGSLELSVATEEQPPRYFNLQLQGAFTMDRGWFTDLRLSRVIVRDHDWSSYVTGMQLAENANQSLANQRAEQPEAAMLLDGIEHLAVEGGSYVIRLQPDSVAMQRLCGAR